MDAGDPEVQILKLGHHPQLLKESYAINRLDWEALPSHANPLDWAVRRRVESRLVSMSLKGKNAHGLGYRRFHSHDMPSGQHLGRHGTVSESVTVYFGNSFNRFLKTSKRFIAGCFMAYR